MEMKLVYEAPEAELLLFQFEGNFLTSGDDEPTGESFNPLSGDENMDDWK